MNGRIVRPVLRRIAQGRGGWKTLRPLTLVVVILSSLSIAFAAETRQTAAQKKDAAIKAASTLTDQKWDSIYERCKPWTVNIHSTRADSEGETGDLLGCGIVFNKYGYVITTSRVMHQATSTTAKLLDGRTFPLTLLGLNDRLDLAVAKIEPDETFVPASLREEDDLMVGEMVLAMGYSPKGRLPLSPGIISAVGRPGFYECGGGRVEYASMIQTDGRISELHSGAPLVNVMGEVIGMVLGSHPDADGVKFSLPMDTIFESLPQMLDVQRVRCFELGMTVEVHGPMAGTVTRVETGSPADIAGVRAYSNVIAVDGRPLRIGLDFYHAVALHEAGGKLELELLTAGKLARAVVTLGEARPRQAEEVEGLVGGINVQYYEGEWTGLPRFESLTPVHSGVAESIGLGSHAGKDQFGLTFTGYIKVPQDGVYTFYLASDDGSRVSIGRKLVVNNDGLHGDTWAWGSISLAAGLHRISVEYFERSGGDRLTVCYDGPGIPKGPVPPSALLRVEKKE